MAAREVRSLAYQMKVARFPAYRDLNGFDFSCSDVNEAIVRQLHRCEFVASAQNVVLVGGPGTGKTHLATAIGVQAIEHDRSRVRFFSTIELVNALEQEKLLGKPGQLALRLMYADVVILDLCAAHRHVQSNAAATVRRGLEAAELHITGTSYCDSSVHLNGRFTCWNFSFPAIGRAMLPARKDR